jgi:pilus assembly protein FimV
METLADTGVNESLGDPTDVTGRNPEIDPNATGVRQGLELDDLEDLDSTSEMKLASGDTGVDIDASLLDATGMTQVLGSDMAVDTATGFEDVLQDTDATLLAPGLGDEVETLLAPLDDEDADSDFDFAKTEALPADSYSGDLDDTAESPALAETDMDLDLDDLTAALKVSEVGDTVEQMREAETVEQPRPTLPDATAEVPTMELSPDDMRGDLQEARTMTEVGTKLDLARAYVDMGDPAGARGILDEVLDEGDAAQKQQAQKLLDSLPS